MSGALRVSPPAHLFRALWPILDDTVPARQMAGEVAGDLPVLARQAHAVLCGPPYFRVARSQDVPGSGNVTPFVLVAEAPARPAVRRAYHR